MKRSRQDYAGDRDHRPFDIQDEQNTGTETFLIPESFQSFTRGIATASSVSFSAIADLHGVSKSRTGVKVYACSSDVAKAFRLWVKNKSEACRRF